MVASRQINGNTLIICSLDEYNSHWPEICRLIAVYGGKRIDKSGPMAKIIIYSDICKNTDIKL